MLNYRSVPEGFHRMPWRNPQSAELTHHEIAHAVPSASGVYGIIEGERYLFVGDSWNLRSRLMDLATVLAPELGPVSVIFETCSDAERPLRRSVLNQEFVHPAPSLAARVG